MAADSRKKENILDRDISDTERHILDVYRLYREFHQRPKSAEQPTQSLEDKIERVNPFYDRGQIINFYHS